MAAVDLLLVNGALQFALSIRQDYVTDFPFWWQRLPWFLLFSVLWLVIAMSLDAYDLARAASAMHSVWSAGGAVLLTSGIYLLIPRLTPALPTRRVEMLVLPLLAISSLAVWRSIYALVFVQPAFHQRALVVGAGWSGRTLARAIAESDDNAGNPYRGTGYRLLGFVDDDPAKQGCEIEGIPVLGTRDELVRLVRELHPDELIVAVTHAHTLSGELFQAILDCRELGVPVTTMASLYERITGRVPVEHAGYDLYVVMPVAQPAGHRLYLAVKRLFDAAIALIGCAVTLVIAPCVWLGNRLTSPGDLFYYQRRIGQGGNIFRIVKFRSMVMNAERDGDAVWAAENDERITPIGRFLRRTRLDEVPQSWNVLRGEMSLIGPRPERPEFARQLARDIPFYRMRHAVRPGITGWAQVKYRYASSTEDALVKLQYDLYYIKHQGIYLDLQILLKTVQVILKMQGR
ncbi:MAG: sugar transferase [Chloroflexi bacterium]|nr:sugar transferase [Chloroflexota bacterium]